MRAGLRFTTILLTGGLWLVPASALAQSTTEPATTNTPATDAVGPRELRNFSLPGTATQPAVQPPAAPATTAPARVDDAPAGSPPAATGRPRTSVQNRQPVRQPAISALAPVNIAPAASTAAPLPPPTAEPAKADPTRPLGPEAVPGPATDSLASDHMLSLLPWLAAALALAAATAFLLWRRRPREALAGAQFDLFVAPDPVPEPFPPSAAPRPVPTPPKPQRPVASGIVAARLRPTIQIGVQPLRCLVEDEQVTIEFELDLFNAGTVPARAVLAEASLLNASDAHDQELATFFANPVGAGQRIDAIPPMKRVTLTSQVVAPRALLQEYELAGRKAFVPVIAFNTLYEWSGGKGQTSAAYLVGRETTGDKLGPLRIDQGAREYRTVGARPLPAAVRT